MTETAISKQEFEKLLKPYTLKEAVAIAVSGGADSMALTLLMQECAFHLNLRIIALTVDHKLRPESATEASQVNQWLNERGIEHYTLIWQHGKITSALQKKAREARYRLLLDWCRSHQVNTLMTAHHLEDQLETFLMRLSKGSGLKGLCSIAPYVTEEEIKIIRPLLSINRNRLKKTLERFSGDFIQDPSNLNTCFERVRWRQLSPTLAAEGLTPETVGMTIARFQLADDYIHQQMQMAFEICVIENKINLQPFKNLHLEIAYRILIKLLSETGGHSYPLPYKSLKSLYQKIVSSNFIGTTGGGCYLKKIKKGWVEVMKEKRSKK